MSTTKPRTKLPHIVIVRAPGLLPMLYTPREISEELGIAESTIRDWLQLGLPHERDTRNHLWINGHNFSGWVKDQQKPKKLLKMASDEAYCLHCNQVTKLVSPAVRHIKGRLVHIKGTCIHCGHIINRGDRLDRTAELSQS